MQPSISRDTIKKANVYLAALIFFLMPLLIDVINIFSVLIVAWVLTWLLEEKFSERFKLSSIKQKKNILYFLFIAFYLLQIIGIFYSTNKPAAYFNLEQKFSFFLFPVVGIFGINEYYRERLGVILKSVIAGTLLASVICIGRNIFLYKSAFLSHKYVEFSILLHPAYFAMFVVLSQAFLIYLYMQQKKNRGWYILLFLFLEFMIFMISSRSGIICNIIFLSVSIMYFIKKKIYILIIVLSSIVLFGIIIKMNSRMWASFSNVYALLFEKNSSIETTNDRLMIWDLSFELIGQQVLLGYGPGDTQDKINQMILIKYKSYGQYYNINAHNQYIETTLDSGIIGLLLLLASMLTPLIAGFKERSYILAIIVVIFMMNSIFESVFERMIGVIVYSFLVLMIWEKIMHKKKQK